MTPLRQRFIQDLQLRNRSPKTVAAYVFHLRNFARFFGTSPETLGGEQVHRYLVHLLQEKKASWAQYNQAVSALRFFYQVTCPNDTVVTSAASEPTGTGGALALGHFLNPECRSENLRVPCPARVVEDP